MVSDSEPGRDDEGFSLIEVLLSLALLGTTMAAMGPFFINSFLITGQQKTRQAAVQLADTAIEQVRALKGSSLLTGRGPAKSKLQWDNAPAALDPYKSSMQLAADPTITDVGSTLGDDAAVPTATQSVTVENITYSRTIYVGICNVYAGGSDRCVDPDTLTVQPADTFKIYKFFRVVVLVTWPYRDCPGNACSYITSTLVARASEPIFDIHRPAPLIKTTQVTFYLGQQGSTQMDASGGALPNTWNAPAGSLPPGVTMTPAGVASGIPSQLGTYLSQVTVTDQEGRKDTEPVTFLVVRPPTVTVPVNARNYVGDTVSQQLTTNGVSPYTYEATGLPDGLALNGDTGAITGTTTTAGVFTVTVTVTDSNAGTGTRTYAHTVYPALQLNPIADRTTNLGAPFTATVSATGGDGAYKYSATGLPLGVVINTNTGVIAGIPTVAGRYLPTITVTDGLGGNASGTFAMIVNTTSSLIFTSPALSQPDQESTVGSQATVPLASNADLLGLKPVYTASGLPPGIKLNPGQGTLAGKPTQAGTYVVTVVATNLAPPQSSNMTFLWVVK